MDNYIWDEIIDEVQDGNVNIFVLGDEKEVDLGECGKHKLRIVNTTAPRECSTPGFSQTACGLVLEFY